MANPAAAVGEHPDKEGSAVRVALGDDELRRWETNCQGLEEGESYPWAAAKSRVLVSAILGCLFGEELSQLDPPARAWAQSNSTVTIFTRRLGCLRELLSQESLLNGPDSFDLLQEIFDRVTIVGTEAALASLVYSDTQTEDTSDPFPVSGTSQLLDPEEAASSPETRSPWRRSLLLVLLMVAIAALIAGLAFALTPSATHFRVRQPKPEHATSTAKGTPPNTHTAGTSTSPAKSGSGASDSPKPNSSVPSGGRTAGTGTTTARPGGTGAGAGTTESGTTGGSTTDTTEASGGSTTVKLPGGAQATVPQVTVPKATLP